MGTLVSEIVPWQTGIAVTSFDVLFDRRGHLGVITLNRPEAINAISHGMVRSIRHQLDAWLVDESIASVLIRGSGERGLCAGGDIVSLYRYILDRDREAAVEFWRDEYALDYFISCFPKPVVVFMERLVLGGGMGISAHASHRVVTETSRLGFPETTIGFIPDVGAMCLLPRVPGELGTYLGLTGGSVGAGDALAIGFADAFVPSLRLDELARDLEADEAEAAIARHSRPAPKPVLTADRMWIDDAFAADTVTGIVGRLRASSARRARAVANDILAKSPLAAAVTLESIRRSRDLPDLRSALEREFVVSVNALFAPDFAEGIRAQVIEKDRSPSWRPASAAQISRQQIEAFFELAAGETAIHLP